MIYSYVIAISVKIIPYSLILGFLLPVYSGMSVTVALVTAFLLAFTTSIIDMAALPELIAPKVGHETGLFLAALLDVSVTYPFIWFAHLLAGLGPYSVQGFLFISVLIGFSEVLLHVFFNWALSARLK